MADTIVDIIRLAMHSVWKIIFLLGDNFLMIFIFNKRDNSCIIYRQMHLYGFGILFIGIFSCDGQKIISISQNIKNIKL